MVLAVLAGFNVSAQSLADKMNAKVKEKSGGSSSSLESQSKTAASWSDGEYKWWTNTTGNFFLTEEAEKSKLEFIKNEKGEVVEVKRNGKSYKRDEEGKSEFARYFKSEGTWCLYFTSKTIVIFQAAGGDDIKILGTMGSKCKYEMTDQVEKYLVDTKSMQAEDIKKYNEKKAEEDRLAQLEKEKQFSIKGKDVAKLEIINIEVPEKFGHFRSFKFSIKATLKDGSILSTDKGGFRSDYDITFTGGDYSEDKVKGVFAKDDKITITAVSKYDPKVKASADAVLLYNEDISFNYNGMSWSRAAGEAANSFKIEVKQMKHKVNASDLVAVRITNLSTGKMVSEFKMKSEQVLHFSCKGGSGGSDNGRGNDGATGGNITVIKDPGVKTFNLDYNNRGGKGGRGSNSTLDGRTGRDGTFKEEVSAVNF